MSDHTGSTPKRTVVYIDGFNLYYRCLKGTPYKWLDVAGLCRRVLSGHNRIVAIKYYTARVDARPHDPDQPVRQDTYLRALRTIPEVSIFFGHYLSHPVRLPLVHPPLGGPRTAEVMRSEEKGSDVNLAAHLVRDAFQNAFDVAAVITNDSDLFEPIRIVVQEVRKPVGIINPNQGRPSAKLRQIASFIRPIRKGALASCQFPPELVDATGRFRKPRVW